MSQVSETSVIYASPAWPALDNGSGLAVLPLLEQLSKVFSRVQFIGLTESPLSLSTSMASNILWTYIPVRRLPKSVRFVSTIFSRKPAVCHSFHNWIVKQQVLSVVRTEYEIQKDLVMIFEDLPVAIALLPYIRHYYPRIKLAIRSENVLSKVFFPLTQNGSFLMKLAWSVEVNKIRRAEMAICRQVDRVWAITDGDAREYYRLLGVRCDGVVGISLDTQRFSDVPRGNEHTLIFVGGVDLRKQMGLSAFLESGWNKVRAVIPDACFVLAGRGTEYFNNPSVGIQGLGYVANDLEVWGMGQIVLNPQEFGSGIKLKSVIAMLAGKALVSTPVGVEGIDGKHGIHFMVGPDAKSLASFVIQLMQNPLAACSLGAEAAKQAKKSYSKDAFIQSVAPLIEDFVVK